MWGSFIVLEILNKVLGDVHQNRTFGQFYEHLKQKNPRCHLLRQDSDIPLEDIPDWDESLVINKKNSASFTK